MKFGVLIPYDVPYGAFESRTDIPNSFGNIAFFIPKKRFTQLWQNINCFIAFQLACAQQMFTNDAFTEISYDFVHVFSLDCL